jgi:hypothetical protein
MENKQESLQEQSRLTLKIKEESLMRHEVSTLKPNISTQTPDAEEKL